MREEIEQIPQAAARALAAAQAQPHLPRQVPYLGMGSSYYAALSARGAGADIWPELASEYHFYQAPRLGVQPLAVLLSQSGRSSETLWCKQHFHRVESISNQLLAPLSWGNCVRARDLAAGPEEFSSTKSYLNSLVCLWQGLDLDPTGAVERLMSDWERMRQTAAQAAQEAAQAISSTPQGGLWVLGSGPNWGTACQGALILSETTKLPWQALTTASFDHGPKEVAASSGGLVLCAEGPHPQTQARVSALEQTLASSPTRFVRLDPGSLPERLSPFALSAQLCLFMDEMADQLGVSPDTFTAGAKVTEVAADLSGANGRREPIPLSALPLHEA